MINNLLGNFDFLEEAFHPRVHDHFCFLYDSEEEWKSFASIFIKTGLEQGEKCIYIFDTHSSHQVHEALRSEGVSVSENESSGQLVIIHGNRVFAGENGFNSNALADFLKKETVRALNDGFPALRVTTETDWIQNYKVSRPQFVHHETNLDLEFFPGNACLMVCQYDQSRLSSDFIESLLITHKGIVIKNKVYSNIYYLPDGQPQSPVETNIETGMLLSTIEREEVKMQAQQIRTRTLQVLLEESHAIILTVDENGQILDANHQATEVFECGIAGLAGRSILDFIDTDDIVRKNIGHNPFGVFRNGEIRVRVQGRVKILKISVVPVILEGRRLYCATGQDITVCTKTEQALVESEERFRGFFSFMNQAAVLCELISNSDGDSPDCIITDVNPAYEKQCGISRDRAVGRRFSDVLGANSGMLVKRCAKAVLSGKSVQLDFFIPVINRNLHGFVLPTSQTRFAIVFSD